MNYKGTVPKRWENNPQNGVTVVSDPGLDDLLALVLLQKLAVDVPKVLVATFGNMDALVTAQNAQDFLSLADTDGSWRFERGAVKPLGMPSAEPWIDAKQGKNGLWDIRPKTGKSALQPSKSSPCKQVISLATMTDVVDLLRENQVDDLLIMGGLFDRFEENGNLAELNVRFDVEATQWVFENCGQMAVRVVPAEVAFDVTWTRGTVESIPETSATNIWLKQILLAGFAKGRYKDGNELYDPLAILLAFYPELAEWRRSGIEVISTGGRRGQTILSDQNPPCDIAVRVLDPEAVAQKLFDLIFLEAIAEERS